MRNVLWIAGIIIYVFCQMLAGESAVEGFTQLTQSHLDRLDQSVQMVDRNGAP